MSESSTTSESKSGSDLSRTRSARSCSSFAGKRDLEGTPITDIWLLDRRALSIRMNRHDGFPDENIMRVYEEYTNFYRLPTVDPEFEVESTSNPKLVPLAGDFHFQRYLDHLRAEAPGIVTLESSVFEHITPFLWVINSLSTSARENLEEIEEHKVLEADSRMEWDVLISMLLKSKRDPSNNRVFNVVSRKERTIKLFHNEFAGSIRLGNDKESKKWEEMQDLLNVYTLSCYLGSELDQNTTHSNDFLGALQHRVKNYYMTRTRRDFVKEIDSSPSKAVVDNLTMLSIPTQFLNQHVLTRFDKMKPLHNEKEMNKKSPEMDPTFLLLPKDGISHSRHEDQETGQVKSRSKNLQVPSNPSSKSKRKPVVVLYPHPHHLVRSPSGTPMWAHRSIDREKFNMIHLGYVVHEFKRPLAVDDQDIIKNLNQLRMSLVSIVAYLEKLGIRQFPIFGVAINGYMALVISAWSGILQNQMPCIYLGDRDTVQYNLADPVSAYNYCTFLSMLALFHGPRLFRRLQESTESNSYSDISSIRWTAYEQRKDLEANGLLPKKKNKQKINRPSKSQPQDHNPQGEASESRPTSVPRIQIPERSEVPQASTTINATSSQPVSTRTRSATRAKSHNERVDAERHQKQPATNPRK